MRLRVAICLLSCLCICQLPLSGQQSPTSASQSPQRDPQGMAAIQNSILAQGGQTAISAIASAVVLGTLTPADNSHASAGTFKWESDFTASTYEFRNEMQIGSQTRIFVSNHGNPAFYNGTKSRNLPSHVAYASVPFHLPAVVLLRELNNQQCSIQFLGTMTINGRPTAHIRTQVNTGPIETELSVHDWYLDSSTGLPIRVEYLTPSSVDMREHKPASVDFSNYKTISGINVPLTMVASEEGSIVSTITVSSVAFNTSMPPTDLTQTVGGAQ